ncbi:MAG: alcohol dehydrogenase catalytic domain-containing protein [Clostridiales bacterium]|nr:alcohol dehydrogenase catalytic domain-containing protein [Clostridiales bacterium]
MKAYRIHAPHTIKLDEMEALPVGDNCIKLKNLMCGITTADVAVYDGRMQTKCPIIPLRQCVGFVSEVGANVTGISRGKRVVTYPQASCHSCKACKEGHYSECEKPLTFGVEEDGFLSDFSVVSADDVYTIPDRITDAEAVFIEHIATALNAMSKLNVEKGDQVVIMGATVDGIILAQLAMYYQAVPIVVDMHEDMLKLAQKAGVYFTVNAVDDNVVKKILALTGGHMASACAYLTNSQMPLQSAWDYTATHGRVAVIGRNGMTDLNCNVNGLLEKNIDLFTVVDCGKNYSSAINLLANHTVSVESLYDNIVSFNDVPAAYESLLADRDDNRFKTLIKI